MQLICCENCQIFWTCELKWYRGERHEKKVCCEQCHSYQECLMLIRKGKVRTSKQKHKKSRPKTSNSPQK